MIAVVTHRVTFSVRTRKMWPPNSSDLNTVDYAIWGALQQMVYHRQCFVSVDELKRAIIDGRNYRNRSSTRASVNGVVVWTA